MSVQGDFPLVRRPVNLGIVGLRADWETRYLPVLQKLNQRMRLSAVFSPIFACSEQIAQQHNATAVHGLISLMNRSDVDAVLFLDASWHGLEALRLLCTGSKPVYIAAKIDNDIDTLQACHWAAVSDGLTFMPEFDWRYTPATARLQELIATHLGPIRQISIDAVLGGNVSSKFANNGLTINPTALMSLLDWSCYLLRTSPKTIEVIDDNNTINQSENQRTIRVSFPVSHSSTQHPSTQQSDQQITVAEIRLSHTENETAITQKVVCESGSAVLKTSHQISWEAGNHSTTESLTTDRNELEVMLDLFCRRVVGGLIPVPSLADVSRGISLLNAVRESEQTNCPVELSPYPVR